MSREEYIIFLLYIFTSTKKNPKKKNLYKLNKRILYTTYRGINHIML